MSTNPVSGKALAAGSSRRHRWPAPCRSHCNRPRERQGASRGSPSAGPPVRVPAWNVEIQWLILSSFDDCVEKFNFSDCVDDNDSVDTQIVSPGPSLMSYANRISAVVFCLVATWTSGCCVGPMGCGPNACGPLAFGHPCDGCEQCDGCGELYIDPWINHPPDCCDPCDSCGNYSGQSCGKCRPVFAGAKTLWGYRRGDQCSDQCDSCGEVQCGCEIASGCGPACGGCDSCTPLENSCGIDTATCGMEPMAGDRVFSSNDRMVRIINDPIPSQGIISVHSGTRSYPQDTPRIFKARTETADGRRLSTAY